MKFDLDELNPSTWFEIEDARVCIRVCAGKDLEEIHKKTRRMQTEYKRNQRYQWEEVDTDKEFTMVNDFIIMDWENVCDATGAPIKCNKANKNKLLRESPMFANFISTSIDMLNTDLMHIKEETEKNSSSG